MLHSWLVSCSGKFFLCFLFLSLFLCQYWQFSSSFYFHSSLLRRYLWSHGALKRLLFYWLPYIKERIPKCNNPKFIQGRNLCKWMVHTSKLDCITWPYYHNNKNNNNNYYYYKFIKFPNYINVVFCFFFLRVVHFVFIQVSK